MKKRIIVLFSILAVLSTLLTACSGSEKTVSEVQAPQIDQIRSICELATLECYYHNVAKSVKEKGTGITHLGEKDRTFWIEYTGIAKIGIDMSKVKMTMNETNISITIPEAKLISITADPTTLNDESYISSADGLNPNKITADDQTAAINEAQEKMKESIENNAALLLNAQNRAQKMIENYIVQLGEISGVNYHITWEYE